MAAENYHLKWDSHLSYLNSSVATLYKNEKFADVMLYSSNSGSGNVGVADSGIPTVGISAHKFILSSCSQFFATMFETAPISSPNGVLYVVLPPDLSHRAIQILVQYMYSGEATVANDILSEVLRGGETLKIRGLCRTSSSSSSSTTAVSHHQQRGDMLVGGSNLAHYGANGTRPPPQQHTQLTGAHANEMYGAASSKCPPHPSGSNCGARYAMDQYSVQQQQQQPPPTHVHAHTHQHQQFRGLGASVMPKDSPVIVKSPKMPQMPLLPHGSKQHIGGGISVNKEVAIDPEEKCCYQLHQQESLPVTSALCNETGCSGGCPMSAESENMRRRQLSQSDDGMAIPTRLVVEQQQLEHEREYTERPRPLPDDHCERGEELEMNNYEHCLRRSGGGGMRDYFVPEHYEHATVSNNGNNSNSKQQFVEAMSGGRLVSTSPHPHNFLAIKQEPADWSASAGSADMLHNDSTSRATTPLQSPKQPLDFKLPLGSATVKMEAGTSAHSVNDEEATGSGSASTSAGHVSGDYDNFSRLVCEICKKSFDEPKAWVRHLETHAATGPPGSMAASQIGGASGSSTSGSGSAAAPATSGGDALAKTYVPKKRRRISQQENNVDHVTLLCDLCSTSFETPAEWVRHMNNQHTEIELAMFNSKKDSQQKTNVCANSSAIGVVAATSSSSSSSSSSNSGASVHNTSNNNTNNQQHQHHQPQPQKKYANRATELNYAGSEQSERTCDICSKKFSTHNHMLAHKRSHNSCAAAAAAIAHTNGAAASLPASSLSRSSRAGVTNAPSESFSVTPSQA